MIVGPAPPRARERRQYVMMVGRGALPAVVAIVIMMLGRMRVTGEAHRVPPPFEQGEESIPILQVLIGFAVEKRVDRNVHHHDDQRVIGRMREHVAHELELALVKPALVLAPSPWLVGIWSKIVDVIEHEKERLRVEERIVIWTKDALEGLPAVFPIMGLEIEIVIAADIPPRQPNRAHDRVRTWIEREVVEHDVARGEAEARVEACQSLDQILANEVDFRAGLRLRIGHHHDVERMSLVLSTQRKID